MPKFNVFMKVNGTAVVVIEADSSEEAMAKALNEYAEGSIGICHQCGHEISDPTYGDPVEAVEVTT